MGQGHVDLGQTGATGTFQRDATRTVEIELDDVVGRLDHGRRRLHDAQLQRGREVLLARHQDVDQAGRDADRQTRGSCGVESIEVLVRIARELACGVVDVELAVVVRHVQKH